MTRTDHGGDNPAVIGFGTRNYIIFDGFTFLNGSGINGGTGDHNIIENNTLDATGRVLVDPGQTNAAPMTFGAATNTTIRYNRVGGAHPGANNASLGIIGVSGSPASGFLVHNNEFYGGGSIINMKRYNQNHVFERTISGTRRMRGFRRWSRRDADAGRQC